MEKRKNGPDDSPWSKKRPFYFESNTSIKDMVHTLKQLEEEPGFFNSSHHEITIIPVGEGYTFGYKAQKGKNFWVPVIPADEGRISQHEDGRVIVEGTAQIDTDIFYVSIVMSIVCYLIPGVIHPSSRLFVLPIFLSVIIWTIASAYRIRNHTIDRIQQAVMIADKIPFYAREKRVSGLESSETVSINNEPIRSDSLWSEAISEYDSIK
jgi:hypothetical protein